MASKVRHIHRRPAVESRALFSRPMFPPVIAWRGADIWLGQQSDVFKMLPSNGLAIVSASGGGRDDADASVPIRVVCAKREVTL